jgi:hypothetical protein
MVLAEDRSRNNRKASMASDRLRQLRDCDRLGIAREATRS